MHIAQDDFNSIWQSFVELLKTKKHRPSRVGGMQEKIGASFTIKKPEKAILTHPTRRMNLSYAAGEFLWYLSGNPAIEMISYYAPQYSRFAEDDGNAWGAYGARWSHGNQISKLVRLLNEDPDTRRAVMTCYTADMDLGVDKRDIPCTLSLQFFIRDLAVHLCVTMRSNDVWLGLPYDVFCFTSLQRLIAEQFGLRLGEYHHAMGSLHLYERDQARVVKMKGADYPESLTTKTSQLFQANTISTIITNMLKWEEVFRCEGESPEDWLREVTNDLGVGTYWSLLVIMAGMKDRMIRRSGQFSKFGVPLHIQEFFRGY